jgi:hypothetical protein
MSPLTRSAVPLVGAVDRAVKVVASSLLNVIELDPTIEAQAGAIHSSGATPSLPSPHPAKENTAAAAATASAQVRARVGAGGRISS